MTTTADAYCTVDDLLIGKIPLPSYMDPQKYVNDAADEIDSHIGFVYVTRVDMSDTTLVVKPARLLLMRINRFLASGRLLLSLAADSEDKSVHAYGLRLVNDALEALKSITSGDVTLDGAEKTPSGATAANAPLFANQDATSRVDDFYSRHPVFDPTHPPIFVGYRTYPYASDPYLNG